MSCYSFSPRGYTRQTISHNDRSTRNVNPNVTSQNHDFSETFATTVISLDGQLSTVPPLQALAKPRIAFPTPAPNANSDGGAPHRPYPPPSQHMASWRAARTSTVASNWRRACPRVNGARGSGADQRLRASTRATKLLSTGLISRRAPNAGRVRCVYCSLRACVAVWEAGNRSLFSWTRVEQAIQSDLRRNSSRSMMPACRHVKPRRPAQDDPTRNAQSSYSDAQAQPYSQPPSYAMHCIRSIVFIQRHCLHCHESPDGIAIDTPTRPPSNPHTDATAEVLDSDPTICSAAILNFPSQVPQNPTSNTLPARR